MANLKVKTIANFNKGEFDSELEELINESEDASIQYRTSACSTGSILHSALVIYIDKVEEDDTSAPTGLDLLPA